MGRNPLRCGCGALWLGAWLRRWAREAGRGAAAARRETCAVAAGAGAARVVLVLQSADEAECHASALSSRGSALRPPLASLLLLLLLHAARLAARAAS